MPRTLAEVAAELYALRPEEFVTRRTEEAKAARADGDRALAASIGTLRKPTVSAWVLNQFVRSHGDVVEQITAIGKDLREAESAMSADDLRRLSTARNQLVESLTHDAVRSAELANPGASLVDEVRSTLGRRSRRPVGRRGTGERRAGQGSGVERVRRHGPGRTCARTARAAAAESRQQGAEHANRVEGRKHNSYDANGRGSAETAH